jgi:GPH family glycoside/pentoside/hexuronide:cation symporter
MRRLFAAPLGGALTMVPVASTEASETERDSRGEQVKRDEPMERGEPVDSARAAPQPGEPRKLSLGRKLGFAVGDYACNLYWQSISLFLLFFYTEAVGLSAATAGLIYMIASIWDGMIDPVMGAIADRTRSRWGRYRPYLLLGALPLALSFGLLYWKPDLKGLQLVAWMLGAHMVFRTCYTALTIPYTSLSARITSSSDERSTIAGFRMIFATLGGVTVAAATQPMVAAFGGGDGARGFFLAAGVFALMATAIFPLVFLATREPERSAQAEPVPRPADYWHAIRHNHAFWAVMAGIVAAIVCSTVLGKSVLYYFKYYLSDEASSRTALALSAVSGLLIIPAWVLVTRYIGKRSAWFAATTWGLVGLALFASIDVHSAALMTAFLIYMMVCSLGLALTFWSMLPDTVEYGEWRSGRRVESFIFGLGQFFLKVALGLGAGVFGLALDLIGYVPNTVQTPATLKGMKAIMVVFPTAGLLLGAIAMLFYPLKRGVHESIVEQLAGRQRTAVRPSP